MIVVDKQKKQFLKWCNLTFNDNGLGILRTHVRNILGTQISYLCSLCKCTQFFHNVYISGEHKIRLDKIEQIGAKDNLLIHYD
jgi:hypothetical protein